MLAQQRAVEAPNKKFNYTLLDKQQIQPVSTQQYGENAKLFT